MQSKTWLVILGSAAALSLAALQPATAKPGRIISATPEHVNGATVTSMVYESTGLHGEPITVSGFTVVPDGPVPAGGRPIVAWAHQTVGVASKCAPSRQAAPLLGVPGLDAMIRLGFIVTASDFPGMGASSGPHPFLVGESEGRAVLDSVRAARTLAGSAASRRFAIWGFSQGGHAALFAGKMARSYAPELRLEGVAVAEPATELGALIKKDLDTPIGKVFTSFTLWSWSRVYHIPLDPILAPPQQAVVEEAAKNCLTEFSDVVDLAGLVKILKTDFLLVDDLNKVSPWRELIRRNTPLPPLGSFPVFIAQGTLDQVVSIDVTNDYVTRLCASGTPVDYDIIPGGFHAFADIVSAPAAVEWMANRFAGLAPPNTCAALRPM